MFLQVSPATWQHLFSPLALQCVRSPPYISYLKVTQCLSTWHRSLFSPSASSPVQKRTVHQQDRRNGSEEIFSTFWAKSDEPQLPKLPVDTVLSLVPPPLPSHQSSALFHQVSSLKKAANSPQHHYGLHQPDIRARDPRQPQRELAGAAFCCGNVLPKVWLWPGHTYSL